MFEALKTVLYFELPGKCVNCSNKYAFLCTCYLLHLTPTDVLRSKLFIHSTDTSKTPTFSPSSPCKTGRWSREGVKQVNW